jgi:hypothetical protein
MFNSRREKFMAQYLHTLAHLSFHHHVRNVSSVMHRRQITTSKAWAEWWVGMQSAEMGCGGK